MVKKKLGIHGNDSYVMQISTITNIIIYQLIINWRTMMEVEVKFDCSGVDWELVKDTLRRVGMGYHNADIHRKAFENSQVTVFLYHNNQMIGFGRAISDGTYQSAIYDIAIVPELQKMGLGKTIMKHILSKLPQSNIILYASPSKEEFYKKLNFRKMKTGMAYFTNPDKMKDKGFTD